MVKRAKLLGTSCVLAAALAAGPAAADQLAGFNGFADGTYTHTTYNNCGGCSNSNEAKFGIGMALPLADLPNLNWQVDASYGHNWGGGDSAEVWNFGFSPFWAGPQSRFGLNLNYETQTHFGHVTNGGAFMEWYLNDQITVAAKAGYLSGGGNPNGGNGHYYGAAGTFYGTPDLAITGSIDRQDLTSGFGCAYGHPCIKGDIGQVGFGIDGEFLPDEDIGAAIFAGFKYTQFTVPGSDFNTTVFDVGLRYYTGMASGSLQNRHRNGNVHGWLRGR